MENWIDVIAGFLIVSSALLLALGALSCFVLHVFDVRGKARLLICSMLVIMPVLYPIGTLIPDRHKVALPPEKIPAILPAISESFFKNSDLLAATDTGKWTWVSGDSKAFYNPEVDLEGMEKPSARFGGVGWLDPAGNLWLFGGSARVRFGGVANDLWKFEP